MLIYFKIYFDVLNMKHKIRDNALYIWSLKRDGFKIVQNKKNKEL